MNKPSFSAVVIEDEAQIRRFVRLALESVGWQVFEASGVKTGLLEAGTRHPQLLIVDLGLPDGNGVELIRDLRAWSSVPVIVLSARSAEQEKIAALDAGANDYLTKPFGVGELLARVRVSQRNNQQNSENSRVNFGEVSVDLATRCVTRAGAAVHLTPIEYRLLTHLLAHAGRVLTHRYLLKEVWGPAYVESPHYVRVHMGHLRQKLEADPARPKHFLTETGVGYRLVME